MDWWKEVDQNWNCLSDLIATYHPAAISWKKVRRKPYMKITAEMAEKACIPIRKDIVTKYDDIDVILLAKEAKENRQGDVLHSIFNETWFGMPESTMVRSVRGFGLLCDLCSEYEGEGADVSSE